MTLDDAPPVLRVAEVAKVTRQDERIVRRAIHSGELPALVNGRVIRVHRDSVRAWLMGEGAQKPQLKVVRRSG